MKRLAALVSLCLAVLLLLPATVPAPAVAQAGAQQAPATTWARVDFPRSITFEITLDSVSPVTGVTFQYEVEQLTTVPVTNVVKPDFAPGQNLKVTWTWHMDQTGGLPPGARVRYRWLLQTAAGPGIQTPDKTVSFNDDRYLWQDMSQEGIALYWYAGGQSFAQVLLSAALDARRTLAEGTGVYLERPIGIYVYASAQELQQALIFSQGWEAGQAFTAHGIVIVGVAPGELDWGRSVLAHELAHVVIDQLTHNPYGDIPTWLSEGLATYAEGALRPGLKDVLDEAIAADSLITVYSLSSAFPSDAREAALSYAESFNLVRFLIGSRGADKMGDLLEVFREGNAYDDALLRVYGLDSQGLNALWRSSLGLSPQPRPLSSPAIPGSHPSTSPEERIWVRAAVPA